MSPTTEGSVLLASQVHAVETYPASLPEESIPDSLHVLKQFLVVPDFIHLPLLLS